jgi:hypothetical protein
MARFEIDGQAYDLVMTIRAMEAIENEFGDLKDALETFRSGGRDIKIIKKMFRILANAGRHKAKQPEDVTGDEIGDLNLDGLNRLSIALRAAMDESMHAETVDGGVADDEECDVYAEELERQQKNGRAGGESVSGNTTDTP